MNLERHIDRATELYKKAFDQLDKWERARTEAMNKAKKDALRLTREAAVEENAKLVREYSDRRAAIVGELNAAIAAVEADFQKDLKAFYMPDGASIDAADQALLASGILSAEEVAAMVAKHAENTTMLRIINKHATENRMKLETAITSALHRAAKGGENEQRVYNTFKQLISTPVKMAEQGLANTEAFMTAALRADDYASSAKAGLLKAKIFLDDATKEALQKYAAENTAAQNAGYDPHKTDYNWN